ncbi:MAG: extracellular solute-binding protein [Phycisphaerales bacterium]|nr:extracellular solute-binding protein [Phycisphaerales bacterium]
MLHSISVALISLRSLSAGIWVIVALFLLSGIGVLFSTQSKSHKLEMWVFSPEHQAMYLPMIESQSGDERIKPHLSLLSIAAIKSRMMSGFFGGLPTADLIEVERSTVGQAFMGPIEAIGFRDLTDRMESEGLLELFNPPSLSPWSVQGRVFGLPHDVHPVMLAYRADLVEAAGIDLEQVETWEEFFDALAPMMTDADGNGINDRYAMSFWYTQPDNVELLLLQGGGHLFDAQSKPTLNSSINAEILSTIVSWCVDPSQPVIDIDEFSAAGHQARIDGKAIAYLCPDWMCSIWKMHVPLIAGKMKLIPLPAFKEGGRRTSVRGGTMLGFPRSSENFDTSWESAKLLYTSPEIARELYRSVDIITPVRSLWDDPVYDEPDPFFMNQRKGQMYIDLAPNIPTRTSSPYNTSAVLEVRDAAVNLASWAKSNEMYQPEDLEAKALELLEIAHQNIVRKMARNAFTGVEN